MFRAKFGNTLIAMSFVSLVGSCSVSEASVLALPHATLSVVDESQNTKGFLYQTIFSNQPVNAYNLNHTGSGITLSNAPPTLYTSAQGAAGTGDNSQIGLRSYGYFSYYFEVVGPQDVYVPINVKGFIHTEANSVNYALPYAGAAINIGDTSFAYSHSIANTFVDENYTKNFDDIVQIRSNRQYGIYMNAQSNFTAQQHSCGNNDPKCYIYGGATVIAEVDPILSIASSFNNASDYSLVFSEGIINAVSAVPLPASAPMFGAALLGLAGLGYAAKRKKETAVA